MSDESKKEAAWNGVILSLKQIIHDLKEIKNPLLARRSAEFYIVDDEYDVEVMVSLKKKLTKKERFEDMFHG